MREDEIVFLSVIDQNKRSWLYDRIIQTGYDQSMILDRHLDQLDTRSYAKIVTRPIWVKGNPFFIQFTFNCWRPHNTRITILNQRTNETVYEEEIPLYVTLGHPVWRPWRDGVTQLDNADSNFNFAIKIEWFDADEGWKTARDYNQNLNIQLVDHISELMPPFVDPEFDQLLKECLKPILYPASTKTGTSYVNLGFPYFHYSPQANLRLDRLTTGCIEAGITTLGWHLEVVKGDTVVATGHAWWSLEEGFSLSSIETLAKDIVLDKESWRIGLVNASTDDWTDALTLSDSDPPLRLRLRGDGLTALRHFEGTSYWEGEIELPLEIADY